MPIIGKQIKAFMEWQEAESELEVENEDTDEQEEPDVDQFSDGSKEDK